MRRVGPIVGIAGMLIIGQATATLAETGIDHHKLSMPVLAGAPPADVPATGSYAVRPTKAERILGTIRTAPADRSPSAPASARSARFWRRWVTGRGFDACNAPSLRAMRAWRRAFVAANVYIGGPVRACRNRNLTAGWVRTVRAMGWRLIPTYVGPQAPCSRFHNRFTARWASVAGRRSAVQAVWKARSLGMPAGTPIYYDLEPYGSGKTGCRTAVLRFMAGWSRRLWGLGYIPGVYGSARGGIRDLGRAWGISKPATIWFAHWDRRRSVRRDRFLRNSWWSGHRRIKQHRGEHREKHGGIALRIDSDSVDGLVY